MNVLKQAALRHLIRRRNVKSQFKPVESTPIKPKEEIITKVIIDQNRKEEIITKVIIDQNRKEEMSTLGEIARVSTPTQSKPYKPTFEPIRWSDKSLKELIIEFIKENPDKCRNTRAKEIAANFVYKYPNLCTENTAQIYINQLIKKGAIVRIPNKGHMYVGSFVIPTQKDAQPLPTVATKEPTKVEEPKKPTEAVSTKPVATPTALPVEVKAEPIPGGMQLSITLNINLNLQK